MAKKAADDSKKRKAPGGARAVARSSSTNRPRATANHKPVATKSKPASKTGSKPAAKPVKTNTAMSGKAASATTPKAAPSKPSASKSKAPPPKTAVGKHAPKSAKAKEAPLPAGVVGKKSLAGRTVVEAATGASTDDKGYVFINGRRVRMISTKGRVVPKKSRSAASRAAAVAAAQEALAATPTKTKLTRKELNSYRDLLLMKRRQLVGDLNAMESEALRSTDGTLSHMPIHMADIGTDTFDQDFRLRQAEQERQLIREIDQALARIEDGTYGVCAATHKPIPKARLDAKPWARYTIEAARKLEGQVGY